MNNELKRCTLESLDDITDKIHDGTLFEGENEKLIKKLLFEEYAKMHIEGIVVIKVSKDHILYLVECL